MSLDDDIRVLSGVGLFEGFTQEQLRLMAFGAENISLSAGRLLYAEGAPADCAFVVVSGTVVLYHERDNGRQILQTLGPGSMLGEFALIAEGHRLTAAAAETDLQLIRLNRSMFRRILEEYPESAARLRDRIADQLQDLIARITRTASRLTK